MGRFFSALWYFVTLGFLRRSEDIRKAADDQFTGSTSGIRAAFGIERDSLASDFRNLQEAVAGVLNVVEQRKADLHRLDEEEQQLKMRVEGALAAAEKAEAGSEDFNRAQAAYQRYAERITQIDADQERKTGQVADLEKSMTTHMARLTELKAKLESMPQQEAEALAEFVSAREIISLNNRLMNAQDSLRASLVTSVMEKVRNMSAQARITEKLVGTDAKLQDTEYERLGEATKSGSDFAAVLSARKAQRDTAQAAPLEAAGSEREATTPTRPRI